MAKHKRWSGRQEAGPLWPSRGTLCLLVGTGSVPLMGSVRPQSDAAKDGHR